MEEDEEGGRQERRDGRGGGVISWPRPLSSSSSSTGPLWQRRQQQQQYQASVTAAAVPGLCGSSSSSSSSGTWACSVPPLSCSPERLFVRLLFLFEHRNHQFYVAGGKWRRGRGGREREVRNGAVKFHPRGGHDRKDTGLLIRDLAYCFRALRCKM